jgi:enoyl-CoA hydratase/carnithine racemase
MRKKYVLTEKKGEIGYLILNRPQASNFLNQQFFSDIIQTLLELDADPKLRLIMVKGAGDNFCMGADVAEIVVLDKYGCRNFFLTLNQMYQTFHRVDKVIIAMVHGYATAGGMGIVSSCDLVVASEDAKFGMTAINVGLCCMTGTAVMLPRIVGSKKALEMGLTGKVISAQEAERLGLINMVVPKERLEPAAMELARKILNKNPVAIVMGRRNFYTVADMEYDKALEHSAEAFGLLAGTEEAKEGMRAFLENRQPSYKRAGSG